MSGGGFEQYTKEAPADQLRLFSFRCHSFPQVRPGVRVFPAALDLGVDFVHLTSPARREFAWHQCYRVLRHRQRKGGPAFSRPGGKTWPDAKV